MKTSDLMIATEGRREAGLRDGERSRNVEGCALSQPMLSIKAPTERRPPGQGRIRPNSQSLRRTIFCLALCFHLGTNVGSQAITFSFDNINQAIPDGSALGLSDSRVISTPGTSILNVTITLTISGDFNGDLYAQVTHGSGFSVLLNRVGKTALNEFGYGDSGLGITLSDSAPAGDVHVYRTTLFGNDNTPVTGPLTGTWAPDARTTDPDLVLNTNPRSAFLSSFNGVNPNGTWTLFLADTSAGGQSTLQSWAVNADVVPEPGSLHLLLAGACLLWAARRGNPARR